MRSLMVTLVVGTFCACGAAQECASGEATGVSLQLGGSALALDHRVCMSGGADGEGWVSMLTATIKAGTLTNLQISVNRLEERAPAECKTDVSVVLSDDPANRNDFISPNFTSDWRESPPTSCAITALRAGEKLEGTFSGHLRRLRNDGVTAEFADVGFTYSVVAPKPR